MQINKITFLNQSNKTFKQNTKAVSNNSTNDFSFSSASASALKSMNTLSFKGDFNLRYIKNLENEIMAKAMNVNAHASNVELEADNLQLQASWLYDCALYEFERLATAKSGKINHAWGGKDVEVLSQENVDGRILPSRIAKYNSDGEINFEACFDDGRLSRVFVNKQDNSKDVYVFNKNTAKLESATIGKTDSGFEEEYTFGFADNEVVTYKKGFQYLDGNKRHTDEIMTFDLDENNKTRLSYYQKNRVQYLADTIETGETFFFDDADNTIYHGGYKKTPNGAIEQKETLIFGRYGVQEYQQGFRQLEDGTKVYLPKMKKSDAYDVITVLDYGYTLKPDGELIRKTYIENQGGIYHQLMRWLGFLS